MTFRIDRRVARSGEVILSLSGRITSQGLEILQDVIRQEAGQFIIDLKDVLLVDGAVVRLLSVSEASGIELRNCPAYIRKWIAQERAQASADPSKSAE